MEDEKNGTPLFHDLSSQAKKEREMFHVSCLLFQKQKGRAKESCERYGDIPQEDVPAMKACHFVRNDHGTALLRFFFCWI